jgi:hypothetical protein
MSRAFPTFYTTEMGGVLFEGIVSGDGPMIYCEPHGVNIGLCTSIEKLSPSLSSFCKNVPADSWWVAKYKTQPRIDLSRLDRAGRGELARRFGIPFKSNVNDSITMFWESPAGDALVEWMKKYPRKAKAYEAGWVYLHGWPGRSTGLKAAAEPPRPRLQ